MVKCEASFQSSFCCDSMYSFRVMPSIYSITMNLISSLKPTSSTFTMFGWDSMETAFDSFLNRCRNSSFFVYSFLRIFTATSRPSRRSNALYTSAIPPTPIRFLTSYLPSRITPIFLSINYIFSFFNESFTNTDLTAAPAAAVRRICTAFLKFPILNCLGFFIHLTITFMSALRYDPVLYSLNNGAPFFTCVRTVAETAVP